MKKADWNKKIKKACEDAGTYRAYFDTVIDTLAGIMELRDNAQEKFLSTGGQVIVKHTNKGGATNIVKNPALTIILDCNAQALAYWRDLGLTPAGYKRLNAEVVQKESQGNLEALLEKMMG